MGMEEGGDVGSSDGRKVEELDLAGEEDEWLSRETEGTGTRWILCLPVMEEEVEADRWRRGEPLAF